MNEAPPLELQEFQKHLASLNEANRGLQATEMRPGPALRSVLDAWNQPAGFSSDEIERAEQIMDEISNLVDRKAKFTTPYIRNRSRIEYTDEIEWFKSHGITIDDEAHWDARLLCFCLPEITV